MCLTRCPIAYAIGRRTIPITPKLLTVQNNEKTFETSVNKMWEK
jgi:hypothetical protein